LRRIVVIDRGVIIADATPRQLKDKVPAKRVTFSVAHPMSEADFAGLGATTVEVSATKVRLLTNEPERALRELFQRGVGLHDLEVAGADLEEAFLALTVRKAAS